MTCLVSMPAYSYYWRESTRYSLIADTMSRNRFQSLRQYLHVNENNKVILCGQPHHYRLFKIRPLVDSLRENMKKIVKEEHISIDEFIIPFKGRSVLKQYIKNQRHKWGIKVFALCGISGILHDFDIYTGKYTVTNKTNHGVSGDIVMRLVETAPQNKNYKLYIDNWFSSYHLTVQLKECNLLMAGTICENRITKKSQNKSAFPRNEKELRAAGRGSNDYATDDKNVTVVK